MKKIIAIFCLAALTTAGIAVTYNSTVDPIVTADARDKDKDKDKDKKKKDCCSKDAAATKSCNEGASAAPSQGSSTERAVKATETGSAGSAATSAPAAKSCCKGAAAKSCDKAPAPNP